MWSSWPGLPLPRIPTTTRCSQPSIRRLLRHKPLSYCPLRTSTRLVFVIFSTDLLVVCVWYALRASTFRPIYRVNDNDRSLTQTTTTGHTTTTTNPHVFIHETIAATTKTTTTPATTSQNTDNTAYHQQHTKTTPFTTIMWYYMLLCAIMCYYVLFCKNNY